jgi:hypothetical protein
MTKWRKGGLLPLLVACVALFVPGCGQQTAEAPGAGRAPTTSQSPPGSGGPGLVARGGQGRQEAFLARIKQAARGNGAIREARMNGDDELGVVLGSQVKLGQLKPLMTTLMREMRDEFPGRALTVRAYAPNGKEMAVMQHDPSRPASANTTFTSRGF